jgi:hypothetical protein
MTQFRFSANGTAGAAAIGASTSAAETAAPTVTRLRSSGGRCRLQLERTISYALQTFPRLADPIPAVEVAHHLQDLDVTANDTAQADSLQVFDGYRL